MRTRESEEMYLETILLLKKKKGNVRSVDVVEELGYAKSSVSRAVNLLIQKGYVNMDRNGDLTLTASGEEKASSVFERHYYITRALIKMGADAALAEANACRIEHVVSDDMFELIKNSPRATEMFFSLDTTVFICYHSTGVVKRLLDLNVKFANANSNW